MKQNEIEMFLVQNSPFCNPFQKQPISKKIPSEIVRVGPKLSAYSLRHTHTFKCIARSSPPKLSVDQSQGKI